MLKATTDKKMKILKSDIRVLRHIIIFLYASYAMQSFQWLVLLIFEAFTFPFRFSIIFLFFPFSYCVNLIKISSETRVVRTHYLYWT